jgi:transcriptional regulator with XRE-family HTH domain
MCQVNNRSTRLPSVISSLHRVRAVTKLTQPQFANRIGISTALLQGIELGQRALTARVINAIHLVTGVDPSSWAKKHPTSTLGGKFDEKSYDLWKMVCQNENEEAPKRVISKRVKALELIGQAMAQVDKGILWEADFREFLLRTVQRYKLEKNLQLMKSNLEKSGGKWPDEAFLAPQGAGMRASAASGIIKYEK